jgi:hypothetical protein
MTDMRGMKTLATALALTIGGASFADTADAKDHKRIWKRHGQVERHYDRGDRGDYDRGERRDYDDDDRDDDGDRAAAAIFGFGVGAILGGALSGPHYYAPGYYYQPAPRVYYQPAPVVGTYGLAPWTPEWYAYCEDRYRSFNPKTGYFLGYDDQYHFCR